jgi:hypothetical protein
MKKFFAMIAMVVLSAPSFAQYSSGGFTLDEENLYYGVRIGLNVATLGGDADMGSKVGMNLAGIIGLRVSNSAPVFLESGLYYSEMGGKEGKSVVSYNNLEIPILVKYGFKVGDNIAVLPFLGPTFGYAIKSKQTWKGDNVTVESDLYKMRRPNMGFKLGVGAEYDNIYLEAGYRFGITNITKFDDASVRANAFFVNFGVNF